MYGRYFLRLESKSPPVSVSALCVLRDPTRPETRNHGSRPTVFRRERLLERHAQGSGQDRQQPEDFPVDAAKDLIVGKGCHCNRDHLTLILTL